MTHGTDGTSQYLDSYCGSYRTRIRANGTFSFNGAINAATDMNAILDIIGNRDLNTNGIGGQNNYPRVRFGGSASGISIYWDGANLRASKNNQASSVVIV
jgi:hypothetical protein